MDLWLLLLVIAIILLAIAVYLQGQIFENLNDTILRMEQTMQIIVNQQQVPFHIPMTFYTDIGSSDIQREEEETTTIKIEPVEEEGLSSETL